MVKTMLCGCVGDLEDPGRSELFQSWLEWPEVRVITKLSLYGPLTPSPFPRVKLEQTVRLGDQGAQGHLEMR